MAPCTCQIHDSACLLGLESTVAKCFCVSMWLGGVQYCCLSLRSSVVTAIIGQPTNQPPNTRVYKTQIRNRNKTQCAMSLIFYERHTSVLCIWPVHYVYTYIYVPYTAYLDVSSSCFGRCARASAIWRRYKRHVCCIAHCARHADCSSQQNAARSCVCANAERKKRLHRKTIRIYRATTPAASLILRPYN